MSESDLFLIYKFNVKKNELYLYGTIFYRYACVVLIDFFSSISSRIPEKTTLQFIIIWYTKKHKMSDKESPDSLDNSLNGEFPLQEKDDGELNMSVGSSVSDSETEKKVRTESPSSPRIPPAFMVAGIWQYNLLDCIVKLQNGLFIYFVYIMVPYSKYFYSIFFIFTSFIDRTKGVMWVFFLIE